MSDVLYEVPADEYLDRQRRMLRARGKVDGHLDPDQITAVLAEVERLDDRLRPGQRYRFRVLGGEPSAQPFHAVEVSTGRHVAGQLPDVMQPQWLEVEGTYVGRGVGPWRTSHIFRLADGNLAAVADMDFMRLERLDS